MLDYSLEPLTIELCTPAGAYEITVSIKAHSDTSFSVYESGTGFVAKDQKIENGSCTDISFKTGTDGAISVIIYCDGDITATAMAENINK